MTYQRFKSALIAAPMFSVLAFAPASSAIEEQPPLIEVYQPTVVTPYSGVVDPDNAAFIANSISAYSQGGGISAEYEATDTQNEWLIYPTDSQLMLFGGKESNFGDIDSAQYDWTIDSPIDFEIDGIPAEIIRIYNHGLVELYSLSGTKLAWASVAPDYIDYRRNAQDYNLTSLRAADDFIFITYELESHPNASSTWNVIGQIVIDTTKPGIGFKLNKENFDDPLFNVAEGELACELRLGGEYYWAKGSPAGFKAEAAENAPEGFENNTSYACEITPAGEFQYAYYTNPQPVGTQLPEFLHLQTSEDSITTSELTPGTGYTAMLRQQATGEQGTAYSVWSDPVDFFTADDSEFQISFNGLSGENVSLSFPEVGDHTINANITNTGEGPAQPVVSVFFGQSQLETVAERVSLVHGINGECTEKETDSNDIECTLDEILEPGESIDFNMTTLVSEEQSYQNYSFSVCSAANRELGNCDTVYLDVSFARSSNSSGSSSGGGAMFWLTLLALPLLRLRRAV